MKKSYYLFNPGTLSRKDNTLKFTAEDEEGNPQTPKYLPIEGVEEFYVFGELKTNSPLNNFLGKSGVPIHYFDYYEHYTGSFMPKDELLSGKMLLAQANVCSNEEKSIVIARELLNGASFNMLKNLKYYNNRDKDLQPFIDQIESYREQIPEAKDRQTLMGIEGNIRQSYYDAFPLIIDTFDMQGRTKQPPEDEVNALISFTNMVCYTTCLSQLYHTQLNPTLSFLHVPGERRYSLALDLAEIFKPLLVDRVIFKVTNRKMIQKKDFDDRFNRCLLKDSGKKTLVKAYEERLNETIHHRSLNRKVSYKRLIRLECYKLAKHVLGMEEYEGFRMWW